MKNLFKFYLFLFTFFTLSGKLSASEDNENEMQERPNFLWLTIEDTSPYEFRSYVILNPENRNKKGPVWQAGRNYNLFRFMMACNAYGENPTMFNGGLFTFDPGTVESKRDFHPDWRPWGGGIYTLQNQRWLYWPMLKWGDAEYMENQFNLFSRVLDIGKMRIRHHYGHEGSVFPESFTVYGLPMPLVYGYDSTYIENRKRAKWMDPGMSRNWAVGNHHTGILEFSFMILEYYRYTGKDISKWLPFVQSSLDFFDQHYRMRKKFYTSNKEYNSDGKLVIFPSSSCESHWFATYPVPDVAGLHAVVKGARNLPDAWIRDYFGGMEELERLQKTLPDLHYTTINGDTVLPPSKSVVYPNYPKTELYVNYPMFPLNQIKLGDKEMEYIHNTWEHWSIWQTPTAWKIFQSWANANVTFARMGITERAADLTLKTLMPGDFRFPAFWGPGYDWVPDHNWGGTGAVGIQEMLMQVTGDDIVLLPAWPEDWDVDFKLHAPFETTVEGKVRKGKVVELKVTPESRQKDLVVLKK